VGRIGHVKAPSSDKNKQNKKKRKHLRLGQSFLKKLLNMKYAAQLSAHCESTKSGHSGLINMNFHTLQEQVMTFLTKVEAQGSEHRHHMGAERTGARKPLDNPYGTTS